jgi:hypothetical protein
MGEDKVEVVHTIDIPGGDPKWPTSVQVERRTTQRDGRDKTYINLLISIGSKRLFIPRRISGEVARALEEASEVAANEYEALLGESNLIPRRPKRQQSL